LPGNKLALAASSDFSTKARRDILFINRRFHAHSLVKRKSASGFILF
jgi:hypothetical protein